MPATPSATEAHAKFVDLLREMFQIDDLDLDFGIYRVLNQERQVIDDFLKNRLAPLTREAMGAADDATRAAKEEELNHKVALRREDGYSDEEIEKVPAIQKLRAELAAIPDHSVLEIEVYNGLCDFFSRYYDKGDFLSRPLYRKDVYAFPYNGEEVKLHWANRDQYYIKSAQILQAFEWNCNGQKVRFQIRKAAIAENNNKEERRFVLALDEDEKPVVYRDGDVLVVEFDFKKTSGKVRDLNADAERQLREWAEGSELTAPLLTLWKDGVDKTHFLHRLNSWTARGSFDFFVHKDLRGFLMRELDFYLKNEVVRLDSLLTGEQGAWEKTTLSKAKAMHSLGSKIVEFLASLEDLQKRLWEKQKWVTSSRAIVPFQLIPEELRADVLTNPAQIAEWKALYRVEHEPISIINTIEWSEPPSVEWVDAHLDIAVDTVHFDAEWTRRLWTELSRHHTIDELWNGILWNADNFAALNLMKKRFCDSIQFIYIDPPYNTDVSELLYKNGYKHSTWLSMLQNRLEHSLPLMQDGALICATIDDYEHDVLALVMDEIFGDVNRIATAVIRNNPQGRSTVKGFSINHEFGLFYSKNASVVAIGRLPRNERQIARYDEVSEEGKPFTWVNFRKTGTDSKRPDRWRQFFPLVNNGDSVRVPEMQWEESSKSWLLTEVIDDDSLIWPIDETGEERVWSFGVERTKAEVESLKVDALNGIPQVYRPLFVNSAGALPRTWWDDARYAAGSHGTNLLTNMFGTGHSFLFPKSVHAVHDSVLVCAPQNNAVILDYFAGSGTTGHAILNLNRRLEESQRRFLLVEMGAYFDSVLVPRLKKAAFADTWDNGIPANFQQRNGVAQTLFINKLESYEDALEHLAAVIEEEGRLQLESPDDEWTVRYGLTTASRDGEISLAERIFDAPFAIQMSVGGDDAAQAQNITVDAVATFNWLLGLRVHKMWFPTEKLGAVCGLTPKDDAVVIIWRHLKDETFEDADAALLNFWETDTILTAWRENHEIKTVYINGDSTLWRSQTADEPWACEPLAATFRELMFATAPRREAF